MKKTAASILLLILGISLVSCGGSTPEPTAMPTSPPTEAAMIGEGVTICQLTDLRGVADHSTNQQISQGIERAKNLYGIDSQLTESKSADAYASDLAALVADDCGLIIADGPDLAPLVFEAAQSNAQQLFLLFDAGTAQDLSNVMVVEFRADQGAFLAGFLAAGVTQTGKVGVFGGVQDDATVSVLNGYEQGIEYYNQEHDTSILLFGWNGASQTGDFIDGDEDDAGAKAMTESFLDQGIDIVLPVAGQAGFAALDPIMSHGEAYAIGMSSDWSREASDYADVILTSIVLNADDVTTDAIQSVLKGSFSGSITQASMADGAVELGPIYVQQPTTSADVMTWFEDLEVEIKGVERAVEAGDIQIP